jgi:hypothetical protein
MTMLSNHSVIRPSTSRLAMKRAIGLPFSFVRPR